MLRSIYCFGVFLAALSASSAHTSSPAATHAGGSLARLRVERIGPEHGLAHNAVHAILEDREAFLWLGTEDGLQRYDGVEFETFRADSVPLALSHSRVYALLETADGALWIGTAAGLDVISPDRLSLRQVGLGDIDGPISVSSLALSPTGQVSVGTAEHGLLLARGYNQEALSPLAGGPGEIFDHVWLPDGGLLVAREMDGRSYQQRLDNALNVQETTSMAEALGPSVGRSELDELLQTGAFLREGRTVGRVCWESDGDGSWIGTFEGLFVRATPGSEPVAVALEGPGIRADDLAHDILALHRDRAGTLWLGTYAGLLKADPARKAFDTWPRERSDVRDAVSSFAMLLDAPGSLFVGTFGGGVLEVSLPEGRSVRRFSPEELSAGRCSDYVWSVAGNERILWVATHIGVCAFDTSGALVELAEDPKSRRSRHITPVADGSFWLSGVHDTLRIAPPGFLGSRFDFASEAFLRISQTEVWAASPAPALAPTEPTLVRLNPQTGESEFHEIPRQLAIFDLTGDSVRLLAGTTDGLLSFEPASAAAEILVPASRIGTVYSVQAGDADEWWLGTSRGIARVDLTRSDPLIAFYDADDSLGNVEFNRRARVRLKSGRILLGGMSGITVFNPSAIRDNPYSPPTRIKGISIEGPEGLQRVAGPEVTMSPNDYAVAFHFSTLNFTHADRNRYRYRLVGADRIWVEAGTARFARYAGLSPGEYRFEVIGSNNDGVWSAEPAAVMLRVRRAFHETWWFRLAAALLVAALLVGLYRVRIRRLIELERVRLSIAQDLHDEFGSELSGIALASEIIGQDESLSAESRVRIRDVELTSRHVMEGLRDVVWYVNPEHDRLDSLVDRIRSTARRLSGDLLVDVEAEGIDRTTPLDMRARRHLFLAFKELLTNAVKHSQASRVRVRLSHLAGVVELTVEDDGAGMGSTTAGDGSGLSSVRGRAKSVNGSLDLESTADGGTRAVLRIPVTRTSHGPRSPE